MSASPCHSHICLSHSASKGPVRHRHIDQAPWPRLPRTWPSKIWKQFAMPTFVALSRLRLYPEPSPWQLEPCELSNDRGSRARRQPCRALHRSYQQPFYEHFFCRPCRAVQECYCEPGPGLVAPPLWSEGICSQGDEASAHYPWLRRRRGHCLQALHLPTEMQTLLCENHHIRMPAPAKLHEP